MKNIYIAILLIIANTIYSQNATTQKADQLFESYQYVDAIKEYQKLAEIKNELYNQGALYASMSGSGSALYGIFKEEISLNVFKQYTCWQGRG